MSAPRLRVSVAVMNRWLPLALLVLCGCGPFTGTRHDWPWAQEYNYLKGQRTPPEALGLVGTNVGPYSVVTWPGGVAGPEEVTVPLSLHGGAVHTPVVVNGRHRVPAVLDTGAPFHLVSLSLAYRLDLPVTRPRFLPDRIYGYGGAWRECGWSLVPSLAVGEMIFTNALASIPLEKFDVVSFFGFVTMNRDEFVILGLDEMRKMSFVVFDFPRGRFTMVRHRPYQPDPARPQLSIPCRVNPGPTLTIALGVDGRGPFPCRIDTGKTARAPALTIPHSVACEWGYWKEGRRGSGQVGIGGVFESQRFRIRSVEMGGRTFTNFTGDSHEGAGEFILGVSFLRDYRVVLDFRGSTIHLEN